MDQITELTDAEFSSMLHSDLSGTQYKNVKSVMQQRFGEQITLDSNYKIAKRRPKMETDWLRKKFSHHYDDFEPASGSEGLWAAGSEGLWAAPQSLPVMSMISSLRQSASFEGSPVHAK